MEDAINEYQQRVWFTSIKLETKENIASTFKKTRTYTF